MYRVDIIKNESNKNHLAIAYSSRYYEIISDGFKENTEVKSK